MGFLHTWDTGPLFIYKWVCLGRFLQKADGLPTQQINVGEDCWCSGSIVNWQKPVFYALQINTSGCCQGVMVKTTGDRRFQTYSVASAGSAGRRASSLLLSSLLHLLFLLFAPSAQIIHLESLLSWLALITECSLRGTWEGILNWGITKIRLVWRYDSGACDPPFSPGAVGHQVHEAKGNRGRKGGVGVQTAMNTNGLMTSGVNFSETAQLLLGMNKDYIDLGYG